MSCSLCLVSLLRKQQEAANSKSRDLLPQFPCQAASAAPSAEVKPDDCVHNSIKSTSSPLVLGRREQTHVYLSGPDIGQRLIQYEQRNLPQEQREATEHSTPPPTTPFLVYRQALHREQATKFQAEDPNRAETNNYNMPKKSLQLNYPLPPPSFRRLTALAAGSRRSHPNHLSQTS